jgi:hypothetical protein
VPARRAEPLVLFAAFAALLAAFLIRDFVLRRRAHGGFKEKVFAFTSCFPRASPYLTLAAAPRDLC